MPPREVMVAGAARGGGLLLPAAPAAAWERCRVLLRGLAAAPIHCCASARWAGRSSSAASSASRRLGSKKSVVGTQGWGRPPFVHHHHTFS